MKALWIQRSQNAHITNIEHFVIVESRGFDALKCLFISEDWYNVRKRLGANFQAMQETKGKISKASRGWAQLISRIYEVDPLACLNCGKKIKIITFVTHPEQIRRILRGVGWPMISDFNSVYSQVVY